MLRSKNCDTDAPYHHVAATRVCLATEAQPVLFHNYDSEAAECVSETKPVMHMHRELQTTHR
ncbi:hypothetical protein SAMN05216525_13950 [Bradyrhizobium sp. Gha]|nr:hypothetical protein SAMN05216525_13950 [Bradyrhizobium sp. Gha]